MEERIPDTTEKVSIKIALSDSVDNLFDNDCSQNVLIIPRFIMIWGKVVDYGGREAPKNILMENAERINFEPTREWYRPYLPQPWVRESPVTQNLEEFGSSHLGSGRLKVVPTSCGSLPCCMIWGSRGWVKGHYMDAGTITIAKRSNNLNNRNKMKDLHSKIRSV
ncbi:uncharacterized protein G2W53_028944 [Senna tora]|uniref:Uncharacterized protein n=1 Tax=Senna tora TaxID=362788 RepID=A0A834T3M7_9FABA|nr:uncharacterized protein G2W53_028944 [Senna tora]